MYGGGVTLNKKAFTLIELLAVIVILAIIALIATPIILGIIGDTKQEAKERSKENYLTAAKQAILKYQMNNPQTRIDGNCDISNEGNLNCSGILITVEVDGEKPTGGNITFTDGKVTSSNIVLREENGNSPKPQVPVNNCTYNGELIVGATYPKGQYTYTYKKGYDLDPDEGEFLIIDLPLDGWSVKLTNPESTDRVDTELCTTINGKPIVSMAAMFVGSQATEIDLSSFDTSNVTNMAYMFAMSSATTLDLSSFDTSKVKDMSNMFNESSVENLDLSSFNTSNVKTMYGMFFRSQATSIDLSSFNTSKVIDMSEMFYESPSTTLDLSSFNTSNVTDMSAMFKESYATTGYAKTPEDAARFNASSSKPVGLTFDVKPAN